MIARSSESSDDCGVGIIIDFGIEEGGDNASGGDT
jgi:hypothetical protein